jgi:hypothetical protein
MMHRSLSQDVLAVIMPALSVESVKSQTPEPPGTSKTAPANDQSADAVRPASGNPDRAVLEREFAETLTGATLRGVWQMTGENGLTGDEALTEPKPESYHITSAVKMSDNYWMISARIEVGDKNVTVPVPVRVEWAGDTPVITLDDVPVPTMGTYSARVMFHRGFYSGTWLSNAKNYGGVMAGRVLKESEKKPVTAPSSSGKNGEGLSESKKPASGG